MEGCHDDVIDSWCYLPTSQVIRLCPLHEGQGGRGGARGEQLGAQQCAQDYCGERGPVFRRSRFNSPTVTRADRKKERRSLRVLRVCSAIDYPGLEALRR